MHGIINLVSLITKTKLGLSTSLSGRNLRCYPLFVPSRHMSRLCSGYPFSLSKQTMAKEFDSTALHLFRTEHGIQFCLSYPYTSQQNKKTEHVLRTLNDCVRTMLVHSAALLAFWAEALSMETHLVNRRPCCATGMTTPFELLVGVAPTYEKLRVLGCRCFPNLIDTMCHKLAARSMSCLHRLPHGSPRLPLLRCRDMTGDHFNEQVFPFRETSDATQAPRHHMA
jgi:hypothetical protein